MCMLEFSSEVGLVLGFVVCCGVWFWGFFFVVVVLSFLFCFDLVFFSVGF